MVVAAFNYLYHPILSRILSVEAFGETQTLFAIFTQAGIAMGVFGMIALNIFTNPSEESKRVFQQLYTLSLYVMAIIATVIVFLSPFLMHKLHIQHFSSIALVAILTVLSVLITFGNFQLRADKKFGSTSIASLIPAAGKLAFAVAFVLLGYGVTGAIGGLLVANILTFAYLMHKTYSAIGLPRITRIHWDSALRRELLYGGMILATSGFVTLLYTADILLVNYFFPPEVAARYSGISVVARVIYFASASVSGVLLSHTTRSQSETENQIYLLKAVKLSVLISGGATLVMVLFPKIITHLLIGEQYLQSASLLPFLALSTFFITIINLFVSYSIALRLRRSMYICLLGVVLLFCGISLFHGSLLSIIFDFIFSSVITLALFTQMCFNSKSAKT